MGARDSRDPNTKTFIWHEQITCTVHLPEDSVLESKSGVRDNVIILVLQSKAKGLHTRNIPLQLNASFYLSLRNFCHNFVFFKNPNVEIIRSDKELEGEGREGDIAFNT